jgi:hypothetical protein
VLRRGSSSKKKKGDDEAVSDEPLAEKVDKKAAKKAAAAEKAAAKKAAKEQAAEEKAAKKAAKKKPKEPVVAAAGLEEPRGVLVRRPKTNIYTVLLGISAAALAIGCLILIVEIWQYGPIWATPWNVPPNLR